MMLLLMGGAFAVDLSGYVAINQTSDTAANAKINAMNTARRQILFNVLSKYADKDEVGVLISEATDDELVDLIASSSVSNEQISADSYLANVKMDLDNDAVISWLDAKGIRNWVPTKDSNEMATVFVVVQNGISDWAELKRIARALNIELDTQTMAGNQAVVKIPLNNRTRFTMAVREAGWKYSDMGGALQIWK